MTLEQLKDIGLYSELIRYLNTLTITNDNIGDIRRSLFREKDGIWNAWIRDETAARENK